MRGYAGARMIILDEASRVEDALITSLRPPMMATVSGSLIALSTPAGERDSSTRPGPATTRVGPASK